MLNWAKQFNIFCYLDNQQYSKNGYECLLAAGADKLLRPPSSFQDLDSFTASGKWCFGHFSYELKKEFFPFGEEKEDKIGFPLFFFFQPQNLLMIRNNQLIIQAEEPDSIYQQILTAAVEPVNAYPLPSLTQRLHQEEYIATVEKLRQHILKGDCYEINFCQEFFAEEALIDPLFVYQKLAAASPTPFSAFYRVHDKYLLCASPERYLKKEGSRLVSQPMKGTVRRNLNDGVADKVLKDWLQKDAKERAENVMVVDLVRNDLSKVCKEASVQVEELFGVYTFPQVHQMVSTVSGELMDNISFSEIIKASFPMGSMTGAPKQRVLQLIEAYEPVGRGLFSGSVGYINPEGDFDFNVVIRSILYNASARYLSYYTGSGITFYSDAEKEWQECLLKGEAIKRVLTEK